MLIDVIVYFKLYKYLQGNPKPQVSLDRTEFSGQRSEGTLLQIYSGQVGEFNFWLVQVGFFLCGYETILS